MSRPAGSDGPGDDSRLFVNPITIPSTSVPLRPLLPPHEEFSSNSYLPRSARAVPHAQTVHSIFINKVPHPLSLRPDELWIVELNSDGHETWRCMH